LDDNAQKGEDTGSGSAILGGNCVAALHGAGVALTSRLGARGNSSHRDRLGGLPSVWHGGSKDGEGGEGSEISEHYVCVWRGCLERVVVVELTEEQSQWGEAPFIHFQPNQEQRKPSKFWTAACVSRRKPQKPLFRPRRNETREVRVQWKEVSRNARHLVDQ